LELFLPLVMHFNIIYKQVKYSLKGMMNFEDFKHSFNDKTKRSKVC